MGQPRPFLIYFRLFKDTLQFLQQINVKNLHPVYSAGIRTHDLWNITTRPGLPPGKINFTHLDAQMYLKCIHKYLPTYLPSWPPHYLNPNFATSDFYHKNFFHKTSRIREFCQKFYVGLICSRHTYAPYCLHQIIWHSSRRKY